MVLIFFNFVYSVDCITINLGCRGGWIDRTIAGVISNGGGMNTESAYPYTASQGSCRYDASSKAATVQGYEVVNSGDEGDLLVKVSA